MTGIERLRELVDGISPITALCGVTKMSYDVSHIETVGARLRDFLSDIADQIERERAEDCYRMGLDYGAVWRVVSDMERHILGHEGMDDSPVARWARELRGALGGEGHDHAEDVSVSAYDPLSEEDADAIAWVREHGGLDAMVELSSRLMTVDALRAAIEETCTRIGVERTGDLTQDAQAIWREIGALRSRLKESVPRAAYERHLARRQRQIDESHAALRRRNARIGFLVSELNRANHENHEEFMRRAGDYTAFTDEVCKLLASELRYVEGCSKDVMDAALDALDRRLMPEGMEWPRYEDGGPVRIGGEFMGKDGKTYTAKQIQFIGTCFSLYDFCDRKPQFNGFYGERVKRPAVPAADGEPLGAGQTVWRVDTGAEYWVKSGQTITADAVVIIRKTDCDCESEIVKASQLTHTKPEIDSWERVEEDARGLDSGVDRELFTHTHEDIVHRCRALAERERGA